MADELTALQEQFPAFHIWEEPGDGRTRYVARSIHLAGRPHTVVAADPSELRAALAQEAEKHASAPPAVTAMPNIARMYDYWVGGKDHHAADRQAAASVADEFPAIAQLARANRAFTGRAVRHVAAAGISQFIDIGAGLPESSAVHQTARDICPAARIAYIDNDPVVLAHARALAAAPGITVIDGDLRDPEAILASPALSEVIDLSQPACLILASVLHFLDPATADTAVATLTAALAPGSYLVISAGTATGTSPAVIDRLRAAYQGNATVAERTCDEIAAWFAGLDLLSPGLVDVCAWRPDSLWHWPSRSGARIIGGVGRKPGHPDDDTTTAMTTPASRCPDRSQT
jgi:O-methyltransferase involved in polyketide biosynthesis